MSVMESVFGVIENVVTPVAARVASQRHVVAVKDGFIGALPFLIVGSFLLIFAYPPFPADTTMAFGQWWLGMAKTYKSEILTPFNMTMNIMAVYTVCGIAYSLAKSYKIDAISNALLALMAFLLVASPLKDGSLPAEFIGGKGLFTAILVSFFTIELVRFLKRHNIGIKMPEQVPDNIRDSFNLLVPALVIILTIYPLNLFLIDKFGMGIPASIMAIFKPLVAASDTLPGILLAAFIAHLLWFAGIHGASVVNGILMPFYLANLSANQAALAAGQPLEATFIKEFWSFFITIGGSGATMALLFMFLRSKAVHLRSIGKLATVPAIFNINEPIIFGSPIVMNPIMFFPFIIAPMLNGTIAWFCAKGDLIGRVVSLAPWTTPAPLGAAWSAGWLPSNAILVLLLIAVDFVIYYPFFKVYEKQLLAEEAATHKAHVAQGLVEEDGLPQGATA